MKTNWRKKTIIVSLSLLAIAIIYDIIVVTQSPNDTESNVILITIYSFPFLGYALCVVVSHWLSLIKTKRRYILELCIVSVPILVFSIITAVNKIKFSAPVIAIFAVVGLVTGSLFWSQRRSK